MALFVRSVRASWTEVESPPPSLSSLQQLLNQKLTVDPKAGRGLAVTHIYTLTVSLSVSRQVDRVVLARLQGSSLTPFEPMSQNNSRRFQSYCQRFPPSAFPRIILSCAGSESERRPRMNSCALRMKIQQCDHQLFVLYAPNHTDKTRKEDF